MPLCAIARRVTSTPLRSSEPRVSPREHPFPATHGKHTHAHTTARDCGLGLGGARRSSVVSPACRLVRVCRYLLDRYFKSSTNGIRPKREGVTRVVIVITDGLANASPKDAAKQLKDEDVIVFAVGIKGYQIQQLNDMASKSHILATIAPLFQNGANNLDLRCVRVLRAQHPKGLGA